LYERCSLFRFGNIECDGFPLGESLDFSFSRCRLGIGYREAPVEEPAKIAHVLNKGGRRFAGSEYEYMGHKIADSFLTGNVVK
jgi:hypothetical protein